MRDLKHRDRLLGSVFGGVLLSILSVPIVCGFNPVGGVLHDVAADTGHAVGAWVTFFVIMTVAWIGLVYVAAAVLGRRR